MGTNNDELPQIKDHPTTEVILNNTSIICENCGIVREKGLMSLRPRKETRFICVYCLQLHIDKINDLKKKDN